MASLPLLDMTDPAANLKMTMSHFAARQDMRAPVVALDLSGLAKVAAGL